MATLEAVNALKQKTMTLIHEALLAGHADHDIQLHKLHSQESPNGFTIDGTFVSVSMKEWGSGVPIVVVHVNYRRQGHRTKKQDGSLDYAAVAREIVDSAVQQVRSQKMYRERDQARRAAYAFLESIGVNVYGNHPFSVCVTEGGRLEIKTCVDANEHDLALSIMNAIAKARRPDAQPIQKLPDPAVA